MCPACFAGALVIAGSVISTGGLATIALKRFVAKNSENRIPAITPTKEDRHG
jgi:hypothetical protein